MLLFLSVMLAIIFLVLISQGIYEILKRSLYKTDKKNGIESEFYATLHKLKQQVISSDTQLIKKQLTQLIHLCEKYEACFCLMLLEIDDSSFISNSLADKDKAVFFEKVNKRLRQHIREIDIVLSTNANTFLILQTMKYKTRDIARLAHRIQSGMIGPFVVSNTMITVSTHMGIVLFPDDGVDVDELMQHLEHAAHHAKILGKNKYYFYKEDAQEITDDESTVTLFLRQPSYLNAVIMRAHLYVNINTNQLEYLNISPYLNHPTLGTVNLVKYFKAVDYAERSFDLINALLIGIARQFNRFTNRFPEIKGIVLPIDIKHLLNTKFMSRLSQAIIDLKIDRNRLIFEIVFTDMIFTPSLINELDHMLNATNLKTAISMYSLSQFPVLNMSKLPIHIIKIDNEFLKKCNDNPEMIAIIKMIRLIAHDLNIDLLTDEIRSIHEKTLLKELGYTIMLKRTIDMRLRDEQTSLFQELIED